MAVKVSSLGAAAHAALKAQVARINALNVYPVPDGDTGTNMLLTLESTLKDAAEADYAGPEEASRAVARAALMGARGNSGVILSQMIRGAFFGLVGAFDLLARNAGVEAVEDNRDGEAAGVHHPGVAQHVEQLGRPADRLVGLPGGGLDDGR